MPHVAEIQVETKLSKQLLKHIFFFFLAQTIFPCVKETTDLKVDLLIPFNL